MFILLLPNAPLLIGNAPDKKSGLLISEHQDFFADCDPSIRKTKPTLNAGRYFVRIDIRTDHRPVITVIR
jgi:hypothetical protein